MIPKFPEFKKLELSDQDDIELITSKYEPYSDFNFPSMWTWDVYDNTLISELNGNLVAILSNHLTNQIVYSYLGNIKLNETLEEIFSFLEKRKIIQPKISWVPEISLSNIDFQKYFIEIDLNSCDYIYDLGELASYEGSKYTKKRGKSNTFVRNYPNASIKVMDMQNQDDLQEIYSLNNSWLKNRTQHDTDLSIDKELFAIKRFLNAHFMNTYCVGVYDQRLIGYSIFSFHSNSYSISHFTKADVSYKGVYEFMMRESAANLNKLGYKYLNYQEDMGILGLRMAKNSYRPIKFLRKYFVKRA